MQSESGSIVHLPVCKNCGGCTVIEINYCIKYALVILSLLVLRVII